VRKQLKRILDRLRASASDVRRERTAVRGGLQEPQRITGHGRS
jgi:hypothetical protein